MEEDLKPKSVSIGLCFVIFSNHSGVPCSTRLKLLFKPTLNKFSIVKTGASSPDICVQRNVEEMNDHPVSYNQQYTNIRSDDSFLITLGFLDQCKNQFPSFIAVYITLNLNLPQYRSLSALLSSLDHLINKAFNHFGSSIRFRSQPYLLTPLRDMVS